MERCNDLTRIIRTVCVVLYILLAFHMDGFAVSFDEAKYFLELGRYLEAIDAYLTLSRETLERRDEALEQVGDIYNVYLEDPVHARGYYLEVVQNFPESDYRDDALYNLGFIGLDGGNIEEGERFLQELVTYYPASPRTATAQFLLDRIRRGSGYRKRDIPIPSPEEETVRVLLSKAERRVTVHPRCAFRIIDAVRGGVLYELDRGETVVLSVSPGGGIVLMDRDLGISSIEITPASAGLIECGEGSYRGSLKASVVDGGLALVNTVPVETYLEGVVPSEMPSSWPLEALKAQAVIARTYVLYQMSKRKGDRFDVYSSVESQVYTGTAAQSTSTRSAVSATRGVVVGYEGKLALTYYHANSGGYVEDDKNVWSTDMPYLASFEDLYSMEADKDGWTYSANMGDVIRKLGLKGGLKGITIVRRSPVGRAEMLELVTDTARRKMSGNRFRVDVDPLKIRSTLFEIESNVDAIVFKGRGFGHGVGLSQWGARIMAQQGHTYGAILEYYYPGTSLMKLYD